MLLVFHVLENEFIFHKVHLIIFVISQDTYYIFFFPQDTFKYDIHFRDVSFAYCQRPDVRVLHGLSVSAEHGHTVALVGSSGCGKSTVIGLMMRFYCPDSGDVVRLHF